MEQIRSGVRWADKAFRLMLILVVISLVLPPHINSYCIIGAFVVWLFTGRWRKYLISWKSNRVAHLILMLYVLYAFGLTYTSNMEHGLREIFEFKLSLLVFPVLFGGWKISDRSIFRLLPRTFYLTIAITILVAILISINNYFSADDGRHWIRFFTYNQLANTVGFQPIYLSLYSVFASFCLYYDLFFDEKLKWRGINNWFTRISSIGLALIFFAVIVMLSSRMEIMVYAVTFSALALIRAWLYGKWSKSIVAIAGMVAVGLSLILINQTNKERFGEMVDMEEDYSENKWGGRSIRIEKWKNTLETWRQSPLVGVGTGDIKDDLMDTYRENGFALALKHHFNPHNQYLQTLLAIGIPGLATLLGWMLLMLVTAIRKRHALMLAFAMIVSMSMLTESMLERHKGIVFITLFSCIFAAYVTGADRHSPDEQ